MEKTKNHWKNKKYLKSLWGGPHGETKKRSEKQKNIFEESLGRAPWRKPKKHVKTKNKKHQYSETLGLPFPIPKTSVFFLVVFPSFLFFFP